MAKQYLAGFEDLKLGASIALAGCVIAGALTLLGAPGVGVAVLVVGVVGGAAIAFAEKLPTAGGG